MSTLNFNYNIRSDLPSNPESPASLGAKFVRTVDALSGIDPAVFSNWKVMDYPARDSLPLAAARSRIAAIIDNNVSRDDFAQPNPYRGYSAGAYTDRGSPSSRGMSLRIRAGGKNAGESDGWKVQYISGCSGGDVSAVQGRTARDQCDLAARLGVCLRVRVGLRQGASKLRGRRARLPVGESAACTQRSNVSLFTLPHPVACLSFGASCSWH